ncbi:MAG: hypothetical protein DWQ35_21715 [Planctomycetota bacterium]|nr:MAG: hypothetical protein DWQ35_21715 [Planctomycetota bacterium]REK31620.1 MAG: hypothetical protein DWQ42_00020 [Planctomycetota bacterium]REK42377.1 MAG: hypothetical protein DWQ46_13625 [Planctomycetota bacterium]
MIGIGGLSPFRLAYLGNKIIAQFPRGQFRYRSTLQGAPASLGGRYVPSFFNFDQDSTQVRYRLIGIAPQCLAKGIAFVSAASDVLAITLEYMHVRTAEGGMRVLTLQFCSDHAP